MSSPEIRPGPGAAAAARSPWRPLRNRAFRDFLTANFVSDIGAFMQSVGAAWLMVSLHAGPFYVALIQTASTLPFFLLVLPAGALADIADRVRLILVAEIWMLAAALVLTLATFLGFVTPWLLLLLTFALAAGDAWEAPAWRALLPELVGAEDVAPASALNGIEFNLARAVGPALAGLLVAWAGAGTAFLVNTVSFVGVIVVVSRWKRPPRRSALPPERIGGATLAALRYARHSPDIRTLLVWTGGAMFFASAILALLPTVAHGMRGGSLGYVFLVAFFGSGAVGGALLLPRLRATLSAANILSLALGALAATLVAAGALKSLPALCGFMVLGGAAWMVFIASLNTMVQQLAPSWVRARVLAVFLLVFQGSVALGSVVWGLAPQRRSVASAMALAGAGTAASILLRFVASLPRVDVDVSPWIRGKTPRLLTVANYDPEDGPVLVTVEYRVVASREPAFLEAVQRLGRLRRRDGATRWGIYRDTEVPDRFVETFIVASWAEHLRQHERAVHADRPVREAVQGSSRETPVIQHFVYARPRR